MAKSSNKNTAKAKKDTVQAKSGTTAIVKAKNRPKKATVKKVKEKLEEEIVNANAEFSELQSKMISEKENRETKNEKSNEKDLTKVSVPDVVSQEKQVEDTTNDLANL